jgi:hypothetical protein
MDALEMAKTATAAWNQSRLELLSSPLDEGTRQKALVLDREARKAQRSAADRFASTVELAKNPDVMSTKNVYQSVEMEEAIEICEALQVPLEMLLKALGVRFKD